MDTTARVQIMDMAVCILHNTDIPGKVTKSDYSPYSSGKIVGHTRLIKLGRANSMGEGKL